MRTSRLALSLLLLLGSAAAASPAAADWLQMRDGSRVQTRGPWQVKGAVVAFTLPNGTLASMRASEVDLEASARITAEAASPSPAPTPAPTPAREAAITITDADLAPASGRPSAPVDSAAEIAATPAAAAAPAGARAAAAAGEGGDPAAGLEVVAWESRYDLDTNSTEVTGTLRNTGATLAYDVGIVVSTFDPEGQALTSSEAELAAPGIAPGRTVGFRVAFPGALRIERAEFELAAKRASTGQPPPDPPATPPPAPAPRVAGVAGEGAQRLRVTRWEADAAADVVALVGELSNQSPQTVYGLSLTVSLQDATEKQIASVRALLAATSLPPGQSTTFRATFPGVREYHSVRFQARESSAPRP